MHYWHFWLNEYTNCIFICLQLVCGLYHFPFQNTVVAPKITCKRKNKDLRVSKSDKRKADWTMSNKKLLLDLALKQKQHRNRPGKAFNAAGRETSLKHSMINEKTVLQYEFQQFKNLYSQLRTSLQTWKSVVQNEGLGTTWEDAFARRWPLQQDY